MQVNAESYGNAVILNLKGEITEDCISSFKQIVDHHLGDSQVVDLVLNMEQVPFIDSAGLEFLLDLQDRLAAKFGRVKLTCCDENVRKILEITQLSRSFEVLADVAEAVKAIRV
jgi:anti-anti-sigma factor